MDVLLKALLEQARPYLLDIVMESFSSVLARSAERHFPEKITVAQASELTGYSRNSIYQMHSKGQIPGALKVGGKLLFDTATLQNWVNNGGRR